MSLVDASLPGCGADLANVDGLPVEIHHDDIANPERFRHSIESADVIFNLAGDISHLESMRHPERDLDRNTRGQLRFVEACARWNPGVRILYASTRQVYGVPEYLPVDEAHPVNPVDFNGVHKYAAGQYHLMLARQGRLDATILRLTNVYGPRISLTAPNQGFLASFLRRLLAGEPLTVFGDGRQLRDPLYVDDAVEAFLIAALSKDRTNRAFNAGGLEAMSLFEVATAASRIAAVAPPKLAEFPDGLASIDIGSYTTDWTLLHKTTGWRPSVPFEEGFRRTLEFFRASYTTPRAAERTTAVSLTS